MIRTTIYVHLVALCWIVCSVETVSFYGESYIHIPLHDAYRQTSVELRFKTTRPSGVLFFLAGQTDYLLLQLVSGTVQLQVKLGPAITVFDLVELRCDDHDWHDVHVASKGGHFSVSVDNKVTHRQKATDKPLELIIDSGAYMGGIPAEVNTGFDGKLRNFRGAFSRLVFNDRDMILLAKKLTDPGQVVEISWDIDKIFDASRDIPVSFQSETSYISFSHIHPASDRTVSFALKTKTRTAILLFSNTRHSISKHYIALQLVNSTIMLTVCKGEELVQVVSDVFIRDDKWHQLDLSVMSDTVELSVNGIRSSDSFKDKTGAVYGGLIFIGGVDQKTRGVAIAEKIQALTGVNNLKGGMVGCVKDIVIDSRKFDIQDVHASRLIDAGCDGTCQGCSSTHAEMTPYSDASFNQFQFLAVQPVSVAEGGQTTISKDNIDIIYNFKKHGIRESGILMYVKQAPKYGRIEVELGRRRTNDVFTYLDLLGDKIKYVHGGSEEAYDEVSMELEIYGGQNGEEMPEQLQERYHFILPITIKPVNDPPKIVVSNSGVLRIIEKSKVRIRSDFLHADDPDTPARQLKYLVINPPTQGYFEKVGKIGLPILEFTQEEIDQKQIWFLHLGSGTSYVNMKLSDGLASSDPVELKIQTVQLQLTVLRNTGLVLPHGTYGMISNKNLSTSSNVPTQELEIRYYILRPPRYGILERQQYTDSEWREVRTFAQRHVDDGHIRYRPTYLSGSPSSDQFSFEVKAKGYTTPYYFFRIQFESVYLRLVANNKLTLLHQSFGVVSPENLRTVTNNAQLSMKNIKFTISRPPSLGSFYRLETQSRKHGSTIDFADGVRLGKESVFSQADINDERIYYKLRGNSYEKVHDFADFRVQTFGTKSKNLRFWIEFIPLKSDIRFINNGLKEVIEGDHKAIDRNALYIVTDNYNVFEFTVISPPQFGQLQLIDPSSSALIETNIREFTNEDIKDSKLIYKHDDSENDKDSFTFTAVPKLQKGSVPQAEFPEFTGSFEIQMLMRNDNKPVRKVDKIFKVVRNKQKLITIDDLAYSDPDIDYDTNELMYTRRSIDNGDFIHAVSKARVEQFKQRDIVNKEILFQHNGKDRGKAVMEVTDGQFLVSCSLEIEAGDPFVSITINTGVVVKNSKDVPITVSNLSVETNINSADDDIRFVLLEGPSNGYLQLNGKQVREFDLASLKSGNLVYKHAGGSQVVDEFKFAVVAGDAQTQAMFSIQMLHEALQQPPRVINNRVLNVYGTERSVIQQSHLLVSHTDSSAENIEYLVLVFPKYGVLYRSNKQLTRDGDTTFSQLDINKGQVMYRLENASASSDQFIFEVSNGYEALRGLEFLINVLSSTLTFEVKNITVKEGGVRVLSGNTLKLDEEQIRGQVTFTVTSQPVYGIIELYGKFNDPISTFTWEDVKAQRVFYRHDGSDSIMDEFSLLAALEASSESEIRTLFVSIEGINDEAPVIVKNEGLEVWNDSMTQITSEILCARDPDSEADKLIFKISTPTNGYVALLNNTFKPIDAFLQSWIDDEQIVFVHSGDTTGSFTFHVSDGVNSNTPSVFHIQAKQLIIQLYNSELLNAYPSTIQPITASHLTAVTNDPQQSRPITYSVTSKPRHGSIVTMQRGNILLEVDSFNQEQINASLVFYRHTEKLNGWTQNDSLEFSVNTLYANTLSDQVLPIYISYGNLNAENKDQLIKTATVRVDEGGEMIVAKNNLDVSRFVRNLERLGKRVSLRFSLEDPPRHGLLKYKGKLLSKSVRFSQRNINRHELIYKHDDSNTIFDSFNLSLHLRIEDKSLHGGQDDETTFRLILNITIQPVNDEPFRLVTVNPGVRIVEGFSVVINQSILNTVDEDTVPLYIEYTIIRKAENGYLSFIENEWQPINHFSQQDINDGRVLFKHYSGKRSGLFYFQVSDGVFRPYRSEFHINVSEVYMDISQNSTIYLTQSESVVGVRQENLNVSTNGLRSNVTYVIVKHSRYGRIFLREREVFSFSQTDIDAGDIFYTQTSLKSGSDYFECDIKYVPSDIIYASRVVNIRVKPLVSTGPLFVSGGEKVALTLLSLDATKLAEKTADNPKFSITKGPYFGRIVKKSFTKRQIYQANYVDGSAFREVREFSHEDVVYTKVFYESDSVSGSTQDNFTYILSAFNVQPAEGVFSIGREPSTQTAIPPGIPTSPKSGEPVSDKTVTQSVGGEVGGVNGNDGEVSPSHVNNNHMIVAIIVPAIIVILISVLILTIFLIWRRRHKRGYAPSSKKSPRLRPHISGPYQIDQPHVHIEPQEQNSPVSEEMRSLVEYANTGGAEAAPLSSRATSEEADTITPMTSASGDHVLRSPDLTRTEVSCTVPTCKVTPMYEEDDSDTGGLPDESRKSVSSMGEMIDWITSDPELMQHCSSTSPPILRKSQYWV